MAYVSDLEDGVPYKQTILEAGAEAIARVAIGRDDVTGTQYSAVVALIRLEPFYGDGWNMELAFDIVSAGAAGEVYISDGLTTKPFLRGKDRGDVLEVICRSAHILLQLRNPQTVSFSTLQQNLPRKALRKYEALSQAVKSAGYEGGQVDGYDGYVMWMFTR